MKKPSKSLQSTAYHEAGHAVIAWRNKVRIISLSIIPEEGLFGKIRHSNPLRGIDIEWDVSTHARMRMEKCVKVSLAGAIAQRKFNPKGYRTWGDEEDRKIAYDQLTHFVGSNEELEAYSKLLEIQTRNDLNIPFVWACVEAVAEALLERQELSGKDVRAIIQQAIDEQSRGDRK